LVYPIRDPTEIVGFPLEPLIIFFAASEELSLCIPVIVSKIKSKATACYKHTDRLSKKIIAAGPVRGADPTVGDSRSQRSFFIDNLLHAFGRILSVHGIARY
jgi:hypothetical protein